MLMSDVLDSVPYAKDEIECFEFTIANWRLI